MSPQARQNHSTWTPRSRHLINSSWQLCAVNQDLLKGERNATLPHSPCRLDPWWRNYPIQREVLYSPGYRSSLRHYTWISHVTFKRTPWFLQTLWLLKEHYWWPRMSTMVKQFIDECTACQQTKPNTHPNAAPLMPIKSHAHRPFQQITMDFITDSPPNDGLI